MKLETKPEGNNIIIREGEKSGKDSVGLLEFAAKRNNFSIFKDKVEHVYESDFIKVKSKCPNCQTATVQMMSNFAYATAEAARISTSHAGHFCPTCPTVIIDDDVMRNVIPTGVQYGGVTSIETGYTDDISTFKTLNGKKAMYILNYDKTGVEGIMQSVHLIDEGTTYFTKDGELLGDSKQAKRKSNSRLRKRNMSVKKMRKRR